MLDRGSLCSGGSRFFLHGELGRQFLHDTAIELNRIDRIDSGVDGVSLTAEFLMALNKLQKTDSYTLKTIKDIFLEAPERRAWER